MSINQQDKDINEFKKSFFKNHNIQVYVFTPTEDEYIISLDTLKECAYNAFVSNHPQLAWINSMSSRTRTREFQIYYQTLSHIAWHCGHTKTAIGRALNKNHASIINAIKMVDNSYFIKDQAVMNAYKQTLKLIIDYVGTIPENLKRKIDTQPNIWS